MFLSDLQVLTVRLNTRALQTPSTIFVSVENSVDWTQRGSISNNFIYKGGLCRSVQQRKANVTFCQLPTPGVAKRFPVRIFSIRKIFQDVKVKAIPLKAFRCPEVFRRLRLLDFKTIGT
jgi:hypothetical protein